MEIIEQVVHVLHFGQPLCGFTTDPPSQWPAGHVWTYVDDIEHITHAECKSRAEGMLSRVHKVIPPAS